MDRQSHNDSGVLDEQVSHAYQWWHSPSSKRMSFVAMRRRQNTAQPSLRFVFAQQLRTISFSQILPSTDLIASMLTTSISFHMTEQMNDRQRVLRTFVFSAAPQHTRKISSFIYWMISYRLLSIHYHYLFLLIVVAINNHLYISLNIQIKRRTLKKNINE